MKLTTSQDNYIKLLAKEPKRSDKLAHQLGNSPSQVAHALLALREMGLVYSQNDGRQYNAWGLTDEGKSYYVGLCEPRPTPLSPQQVAVLKLADELAKVMNLQTGAPFDPEAALRTALADYQAPDTGKFFVVCEGLLSGQRGNDSYEAALARAKIMTGTKGSAPRVVLELRARTAYIPPVPATTQVEEF